MLPGMLKFLLLKFLPRRLLPLLLLYEVWKLVMRMRDGDDPTQPASSHDRRAFDGRSGA